MRVAVIGGTGQLRTDVSRAFVDNGDDVHRLTHADIEISNLDSVFRALDYIPQIVVNTAAMHHVEKCELEPEKAFATNALGARNLALFAQEKGAILIHVSTDYV